MYPHVHATTHTNFQYHLTVMPLGAWLQTYQQQLCQSDLIKRMCNTNLGRWITHPMEESQGQVSDRPSAGKVGILLDTVFDWE